MRRAQGALDTYRLVHHQVSPANPFQYVALPPHHLVVGNLIRGVSRHFAVDAHLELAQRTLGLAAREFRGLAKKSIQPHCQSSQ